MIYLYLKQQSAKKSKRSFEGIMLELKYDVANDTREEQLGIESVHTFNIKSIS